VKRKAPVRLIELAKNRKSLCALIRKCNGNSYSTQSK
jgi:hypothetical protein